MVESVAASIQVVLWPLAGAAFILVLHWLLPNWLRRAVVLAATLASLSALLSLGTGPVEPVEISWQPLNFFRTSPILRPTNLGLFSGAVMAAIAAVLALGIPGTRPQNTRWHGLMLIALAGSLLGALSGNLLTLAMGSGLLDLALVALAVTAGDGQGRVRWRMVVPGAASTLLILVSAVQMDAQLGSTSLVARDFPVETLLLLGLAGLMRLLIFPLHVRQLDTPEDAATLLLPLGAGIYVLARVQTIGPVFADRPWLPALGAATLLAGGLITWASTARKAGMAATWSGIAIHQTGLALVYVLLLRPPVPWPWAGLALALGALATWWAGTEAKDESTRAGWIERVGEWMQPLRQRLKSVMPARVPSPGRWRESWLGQRAAGLPAGIALISLAGLPWTVGVVSRWPFYATLLDNRLGGLLIASIVGDTLLAAGLWTLMGRIFRASPAQRLRPGAVLSLVLFSLLILAMGLAPGKMAGGLGIKPPGRPDVSVWGLGFIFVLPWLCGAWLVRVGGRLVRPLESTERLVGLDWLYRAGSQVSRSLGSVVYWVSRVGEGEGWWGWALIILALGALFFAAR